MNKFNKLACVCSLAFASSQAFAVGIPVVDAAAINQMVQQIVEMQKQYQMLSDQYQKMKEQYDQLKTMTSKLEGITDIADLLRNEDALDMFPEFYENLTNFNKDLMENGAKAIYESRGYGAKCEALSSELKTICEQENSYKASREYQFIEAYNKVNDRISNLDNLMNEIKNCQTAKEIQDLQARIQAELGMVQIANIKVELSRNTFDAALEGAKTMREAKTREYFSMPENFDLSSSFE